MSKRGLNYSSKGLPPEKIVRLRELAAQGLCSREIAEALGTTKGIVMGRVHALGIQLKHKPGYAGEKKPKAAPKNNNPTGLTVTRILAGKSTAAKPMPPLALRLRPSVGLVSISDIAHAQCRYIGERPELLTLDTPIFCGAPTDGGSWCPEHRARCIVKRTYA